MEQDLREKIVWGHVMAIVAVPKPILVPTVPAVSSLPMLNEAKANSMILLTLEQKDVMTLLAFPSAVRKWNKLAADGCR